MPLPTWIMEYLRTSTGEPPGYGDVARTARCPRCGAQILSGMDDWPTGAQADADPVPLASSAYR